MFNVMLVFMFVGLSLTATWGIFYKNLVQYFCYKAVELRNTVYFGCMPPNEMDMNIQKQPDNARSYFATLHQLAAF
jgi:hypothetical protein